MNTHQTSAVRAQAPGDRQPNWRTRAACRDEDPDLHFPVGNSGPALTQTAYAKTVCRRCPVTTECLQHALAEHIDFGIWGGATEDERRAIQRRTERTQMRTG